MDQIDKKFTIDINISWQPQSLKLKRNFIEFQDRISDGQSFHHLKRKKKKKIKQFGSLIKFIL